MSLYLKYRPQNFQTLVGQKHATDTIQNAIKNDTLTHAYLFSGPRGTGKTSLARIMAKALNCLDLTAKGEPCNKCEICTAINKGRLVDLIEIDAASNRGIDEIRELREKIVFAPSQARTKVYIIDEVHMLTKEAFNALLKTLEEPPSHAYFVLATTEAHKIPETIISRCQQYNFKRIGVESIVERLKEISAEEGVNAEPQALTLMAKVANGGLRDAIGLLEQMTIDKSVKLDAVAENLGMTNTIHIEKFFQHLLQRNSLKAIEIINQVNAEGHSLEQFVAEVLGYFREQMLINLDNSSDTANIIGFIDIFSEAKLQIAQAVIPQLPIEIAIVKACLFDAAVQEKVAKKVLKKTEVATRKQEAKGVEAKTDPIEAIEAETEITPEVTIEAVKENWQRILDHIETPFIKMSFADSEPDKLEEGKLHLSFNSATLMEKIAKSSNQGDVQKAFESVFGRKIVLNLTVKKVNLKAKKKEDREDPSVMEMAKEVFGMNVME